MHPLLLIAAALGGGWYLWNRSKSQLAATLPTPGPSVQLPGGGGGSIYHPNAYQQDAANFPAGQYIVSTQTNPLNLRGDPSTNNAPIGSLPKGSTVSTDGVVTAGFTGIIGSDGTHLGWAATEYLTPVSGGVVQTTTSDSESGQPIQEGWVETQGAPVVTPPTGQVIQAGSGGYNPAGMLSHVQTEAQGLLSVLGYVGAGYAVAVNVALQTQRCLNKMGCRPSLPLTGYWDVNTQQCLADFQRQHGLPVSGQADPYTRQLLQHICS